MNSQRKVISLQRPLNSNFRPKAGFSGKKWRRAGGRKVGLGVACYSLELCEKAHVRFVSSSLGCVWFSLAAGHLAGQAV